MIEARRSTIAGWFAVAILAVVIFRPDRPLPFDVWDFREFLPILNSGTSLIDGYSGLLEYYLSHGRMNPLFYLTFSLQFSLFGEQAHLWQLLRFTLMLANLGLLMALARRLGLSPLASTVVAALMVVATPVNRGWLQLMAEPLVLAALLTAALLAVGYQGAARFGWRAVGILLCILVAFLCKEVLGGLGAVVVLLAIVSWQDPIDWRGLTSRRNLALAVGAVVVALGVGVMLLAVRSGDQATGYGMGYGSGELSLARLAHNFVASVQVFRPEGPTGLSLLFPANVASLLLAGLGLAAALGRGIRWAVLSRALAFGFGLPFLGALLYLPWPKFDSFYALPLFVGPALILGAAVDELFGRGGWRRFTAVGASAMVVLYATIPASRSAETAAAAAFLNQGIARTLGLFSATDTVVVLAPAAGPRSLPVAAVELRDYSIAMGFTSDSSAPTLIDKDCNWYLQARLPDRLSLAALTYSYGCGRFPTADLRLNSSFTWRDWVSFGRVPDSLGAELNGPAVIRARGR